MPVPGRDIFVQAWYQGGISVMDFTDSANPVEIAYFDRGPVNADELLLAGYWSTYFYDGRIYGTEIVRGIDVFALTPSEYLSENEIAAAALADYDGLFNPQQQFPVTWPDEPVVALAYLDQLKRNDSVPAAMVAELTAALDDAAASLENGAQDDDLADTLESLADRINDGDADGVEAKRRSGLAGTLLGIATRLR